MKTSRSKYLLLFVLPVVVFVSSCRTRTEQKMLTVKNSQDMKLGFSSQNFLNALPFDVGGLTEVIEYAASEGFDFVEIRDQFVDLTNDDCKSLSEVAKKNNLEIIYVFNKNPLDPDFPGFFERALANVLVFPGPGILRAMASKTEFEGDAAKKGWTKEELTKLARIADSVASVCKSKNIRLVFENSNEAFFGDGSTYFGLADLLSATSHPGLQLDIANLFRNTARTQTNPEEVLNFLPKLGNRWVETHLKTIKNGEPQDVLTENNPLPIEKIIELMTKQNVNYVALELNAVKDKQQCIENHKISIQFLKEKGILN
jgi:sugar phosphate isomerase/epimerase